MFFTEHTQQNTEKCMYQLHSFNLNITYKAPMNPPTLSATVQQSMDSPSNLCMPYYILYPETNKQ